MASTDKQAAQWTLDQMADDAPLEDIIDELRYTLYVRRHIKEGLREFDDEKLIPHREVKREMAQ